MTYILLVAALVVFVLGFGALFVRVFGKIWAPYISSRRQPVVAEQATVASKREEMVESFLHNFDRRFGETFEPSDAVRLEPLDWYASFDCEDGETREFAVPQSLYESLIIGDKGELKWRGSLFVRFGRPGVDKPEKAVPENWL